MMSPKPQNTEFDFSASSLICMIHLPKTESSPFQVGTTSNFNLVSKWISEVLTHLSSAVLIRRFLVPPLLDETSGGALGGPLGGPPGGPLGGLGRPFGD